MNWQSFDEVHGCGMLDLDPKYDDRGLFMEMFNRDVVAREGIPLPWQWAQDDISFSGAGVQRGFHVQLERPQGKLVTCLMGRVMDVCLDVRRSSPTFLKMTRIVLSADRLRSFYLPAGTAHAFLAFEDSLLHYRCTTAYDKDSDTGINASSPEVAMVWPPGEFIRSERDRGLPNLVDFLGRAG